MKRSRADRFEVIGVRQVAGWGGFPAPGYRPKYTAIGTLIAVVAG
jgi:hypothetical protein